MSCLRDVDLTRFREETARFKALLDSHRPPPHDASQDERGGQDERRGAGRPIRPWWKRWLAWTGIVTLLVGLPWLIGVCAAGPLLVLAPDESSVLSDRIEAVRGTDAPGWIKNALVRDMED